MHAAAAAASSPPHGDPRRALLPLPCSIANCTTEFPGRDESDLGPQLAACGCITPGCAAAAA